MTKLTSTEVFDEALVAQAVAAGGAVPFNLLPFSPLVSLRGKNMYTDAAQAVPAAAWGDQVQQWRDEREVSPANVYPYAAQSSAGLRPTFAPQFAFSGGLLFNVQRLILSGPVAFDRGNCTLVMAGIFATDFTGNTTPTYLNVGTQAGGIEGLSNGPANAGNFQPDANYGSADHVATSISLLLGPRQVYTIQSTATGVMQNINGVSEPQSASAGSSLISNGTIGDWSLLNNTAFKVWLDRIAVFSPALSGPDLATVQAGLLAEAPLGSLYPLTFNLLAFAGDSLTLGVGHGGISQSQSYPYQTVSSLAAGVGFLLAAQTGYSISQVAGAWTAGINAHYRASGRTGKQVVIFWAGTNDIFAGAAGTVAKAAFQAAAQAFKTAGWKVIVLDVMNNGGFTGPDVTQQGVMNAALRADFSVATGNAHVFTPIGGITYADVLVDVQSEINLQTTSNMTYFSDGTHLTAAGYAIVAGDVAFALGLLGVS